MPHETAILSAHPVSALVRERVDRPLSALECQHGLTMLFACESGSRGGELRKALRRLRGSNPARPEWLRSPIVYRRPLDACLLDAVRQFAPLTQAMKPPA